MSDPILLVVAGCNGSGKSTFSKLLVPVGMVPFDYDVVFLNSYRSIFDSDIREQMAHNMAFAELERQVEEAIANKSNFCYETNFNSTPLHWPQYFKRNGYKLHLIYFCLNSIEEARRRVDIRVQNGGHFVSDSEVRQRYFDGFRNLDAQFSYFDIVDIFETSGYSKEPEYIGSIEGKQITNRTAPPEYLVRLIPHVISRLSYCSAV